LVFGGILKSKSLAKMVSIMIVGATLFSQASPAKAYWAWGRTWSTPSAARYVYGWSASFTSSEKTIIGRAAIAYSHTSGSTLNVDGATFTSSTAALDSAVFQVAMAVPTGDFPGNTPGFTWRGTYANEIINLSNKAIVFLNPSWTWSNHFDEANRVADFESVTLHEFGHAHGLGHPWQDCPARPNCPMTAAETASVMNVTFTLKRTLTSDDIAGLAAIY
jgi:hypothetical protein